MSSLTLRRGRSANHQMLAIVATTPRAAAGLAIFPERSDMVTTLPGPSGGRATIGTQWTRRRSHLFLPNLFVSSYTFLGLPLWAARKMGACQGGTFEPAALSVCAVEPTVPRSPSSSALPTAPAPPIVSPALHTQRRRDSRRTASRATPGIPLSKIPSRGRPHSVACRGATHHSTPRECRPPARARSLRPSRLSAARSHNLQLV